MTDAGHDAKLPSDAAEVEPIDAVRADIAETRADLAATVDALSERLDFKARARAKAAVARSKASTGAQRVKQRTPEPVQRAIGRVGQKTSPVLHKMSDKTAPHRAKIAAGAGAVIVAVAVIGRRRRSGEES